MVNISLLACLFLFEIFRYRSNSNSDSPKQIDFRNVLRNRTSSHTDQYNPTNNLITSS